MAAAGQPDDTMTKISGEQLLPMLHGAPFVLDDGARIQVRRLDPAIMQHPVDLLANARQAAGARLEFRAWGETVTLALHYIPGPEVPFFPRRPLASLWCDGGLLQQVLPEAAAGDQHLTFDLPVQGGRYTLYLPYRDEVELIGLEADGRLEPATADEPRWVAYGDSITHGWCASDPGLTYPAIAAREFGLHHTNLGFAGSARGEFSAAATVAALPADVISFAFGTNVMSAEWHDRASWRETFRVFVEIVREAHPDAPILVVSPIHRASRSPGDRMPAGRYEQTPTRRGTRLQDLREAEREVVLLKQQEGDGNLHFMSGLDVIGEGDTHLLADGIHPTDEGLAQMATSIGARVAELAGSIRKAQAQR
jgi:lysophospholipase L1-like esterase